LETISNFNRFGNGRKSSAAPGIAVDNNSTNSASRKLNPKVFKVQNLSSNKIIALPMKKWTKIGAVVGGVWGLITGILYAWGVFATGFAGHEFVFPEGLKIICLPAYLTHLISTALAGILSLLLFIIWFVGMPTFFGIMIGSGIGILTTVIVKRVLIK
jgi:hypothetical protein